MPLIHDNEIGEKRLATLPLAAYGAGETVLAEGTKTGRTADSQNRAGERHQGRHRDRARRLSASVVAESRTSMSGCRAVKLWGWRRTLKAAAAFDIFARGAGPYP